MKCQLLDPDAPEWASFLDRVPHDFYHLPGYARASARTQAGHPHALLVSTAHSSMLLPLIMRTMPDGARDATSPYGYPGPLTCGPDDPTFLADALGAGAAYLAEVGLISLFIRLHPLLNASPPSIETIVRQGETVVVDLGAPPEDIWRETRRSHRTQIETARTAGHRVVIDPGLEHWPVFRRLYRETMSRLGVDPFYDFDDRYFDELQDVLGERLHLVVVEARGQVTAAGLFVETHGIVQYHLSGTDDHFRREAPTKLMVDEVRRWAQQRGDRWLHLGGGVGFANDALLRFKAGFSRLRGQFRTLRMVLLSGEYDRLVREAGITPIPPASDGHFPAYRRRHVAEPATGTLGTRPKRPEGADLDASNRHGGWP